jgi:uncharacterized phage-associated protein
VIDFAWRRHFGRFRDLCCRNWAVSLFKCLLWGHAKAPQRSCMVNDHRREKLVQAVVFFASNVRKLGKTKLYKLLYFLDFQHYRDTGRSVTGQDYFAWKMGPVPKALHEEVEAPSDVWKGRVEFKPVRTAKGEMLSVNAISKFDASHFSKRELRLLEALAAEYKDAAADDMVEATHLENLPWHRVWHDERKRQELIPYEYALRKQEADVLTAFAAEREELLQALNR